MTRLLLLGAILFLSGCSSLLPQWRLFQAKVPEPIVKNEAKLEVERNSGKRTYWETVFDGSLITIGFARRFNGVTLVERAGRRKSLFGLLGDKDEITQIDSLYFSGS